MDQYQPKEYTRTELDVTKFWLSIEDSYRVRIELKEGHYHAPDDTSQYHAGLVMYCACGHCHNKMIGSYWWVVGPGSFSRHLMEMHRALSFLADLVGYTGNWLS